MNRFELQATNLFLNTFNKLSSEGIDEIREKWLLQVLPQSLHVFAHLVSEYSFDKVQRVTINRRIESTNKRITEIKKLKYPPAEKVKKYGRCNLPGKSVLYCSIFGKTALSEMRPKVGDLITKSVWKCKVPHSFKICPIFHVQPTNGTLNPRTLELERDFYNLLDKKYSAEENEAVVNLSKFIAHHFSKIVGDNDKDYIFSAYFSDKLLNELANGEIDGILYPSVKEKLSFENLVLKPDVFDKYFELESVDESIVIKDPSDGGGGLLMEGIADSKNFNFEKGTIDWGNTYTQPIERIRMFEKVFELDLSN